MFQLENCKNQMVGSNAFKNQMIERFLLRSASDLIILNVENINKWIKIKSEAKWKFTKNEKMYLRRLDNLCLGDGNDELFELIIPMFWDDEYC